MTNDQMRFIAGLIGVFAVGIGSGLALWSDDTKIVRPLGLGLMSAGAAIMMGVL